jgi:hypothetical protein
MPRRSGRPDLRHPALGQELTLSPMESSSGEQAGEPVPAHRAGTYRGAVIRPDSIACAGPEATDGGDERGRSLN